MSGWSWEYFARGELRTESATDAVGSTGSGCYYKVLLNLHCQFCSASHIPFSARPKKPPKSFALKKKRITLEIPLLHSLWSTLVGDVCIMLWTTLIVLSLEQNEVCAVDLAQGDRGVVWHKVVLAIVARRMDGNPSGQAFKLRKRAKLRVIVEHFSTRTLRHTCCLYDTTRETFSEPCNDYCYHLNHAYQCYLELFGHLQYPVLTPALHALRGCVAAIPIAALKLRCAHRCTLGHLDIWAYASRPNIVAFYWVSLRVLQECSCMSTMPGRTRRSRSGLKRRDEGALEHRDRACTIVLWKLFAAA